MSTDRDLQNITPSQLEFFNRAEYMIVCGPAKICGPHHLLEIIERHDIFPQKSWQTIFTHFSQTYRVIGRTEKFSAPVANGLGGTLTMHFIPKQCSVEEYDIELVSMEVESEKSPALIPTSPPPQIGISRSQNAPNQEASKTAHVAIQSNIMVAASTNQSVNISHSTCIGQSKEKSSFLGRLLGGLAVMRPIAWITRLFTAP